MKHLLKSTLAALGYRVQGTRYCPRQLLEEDHLRVIEFDDVVCRRMFESGPKLTFIQVGAFDGVTSDPLRKYVNKCGWRGVVIEPQAVAVNQLRELYRDNNSIVILQAAVDREPGSRTLFTVVSDDVPAWARGLASFQREAITKHSGLIRGLEAMISEETVNCIPFDDVLHYLPTEQCDLLQIDTEGADAHILSIFPFSRIRPAIVHWEVKHLSKVQRENCMDLLEGFGYRFALSGHEDMIAVLGG